MNKLMNKTNKIHRSLALTIVASVFALAAGGCWYAVAGAGAYAGYRFVDGEYKGVLRADLADSIRATRAAFEDLEIREQSFEDSAGSAAISGVSGGDRGVHVKLEAQGKGDTNIRIRIDTFGDQSYSQLLVDKINAHL